MRVALWLYSEIGEGGTFSKAQLREAFPGIEQVDRRMRDLRVDGWAIATYREDRSLEPEELRLISVGGHVWEPHYQDAREPAVTDKQRYTTFAADDFCCVYCGISGGEPYPDDSLRTAKLTVARVTSGSKAETQLLTVCDRCHVAVRGEPAPDDLLSALEALHPEQLQRLRLWINRGSRPRTDEETVWSNYRRLSSDARATVRSRLDEMLGHPS